MNILERAYRFLLRQVSAESYLEGLENIDKEALQTALRRGNNRREFVADLNANLAGKTRLAANQVAEFTSGIKLLDQWSDDPRRKGNLQLGDHAYRELDGRQILANSGFSATLMQDIDPSSPDFGSVTLSLRSTEFAKPKFGGDRDRDGYGADRELGEYGLAFAQIDATERYYAWLKEQPDLLGNGKLYVTGYSLGGHLAVAFAELHPDEVEHVYIFNSPGRGTLGKAADFQEVLSYYRTVLADPLYAKVALTDAAAVEIRRLASLTGSRPLDPVSIYDDSRERWAALATNIKFEMIGASHAKPGAAGATIPPEVAAKVTAIFGHADTNDSEYVSNMGVHAPSTPVFIEDQPDIQDAGGVLIGTPDWYDKNGDFATTHSITLIGDSLAVMRTLGKLDISARRELPDYHIWLRPIFSAASNEEGIGLIFTQGHAEFDSLENVVQGLGRLVNIGIAPMNPGERGGDFGNIVSRDAFHANLESINRAIKSLDANRLFELRQLNGIGASALKDMASSASDIAEGVRFALLQGQTFVVAGFPYAIHNAQGELDLHDPMARTGDLTEDWLKDRSFFLSSKIAANVLNKRLITNTVDDQNWLMIDSPANYSLEVRRNVLGPGADGKPVPDMAKPRRMVFGGDRADYLSGDSKDDRIYGGRGTDVIFGGDGDDHLEGGEGLDVYRYGTDQTLGILTDTDGADVIRDTDGRGVLRYVFDGKNVVASVIFDASVKLSGTTWESADGRFQYEKRGDDLKVEIVKDVGGGFTLKNFRDGDFGIRLMSERSLPDFELTILGDRLPKDLDPITPGIQSRIGPDGRPIYGDLPGEPVNDFLRGRDPEKHGFPVVYTVPAPDSPGERIEGLEGNDALYGDAWDANIHASWMPNAFPEDEAAYAKEAYANRDWILGGPGRDSIFSGGGHDLVEGGADGIDGGVRGGDYIDGGTGDDVLFGDGRVGLADAIRKGESESASGARGDAILGGAGADWVIGAAGNDALAGGGGDDLLIGGAGDDDIVGDSGHFAAQYDWSVVRDSRPETQTALTFIHFVSRDVSLAGRDTIYGGGGSDWVFSEDGDDVVDGGSGDDVLRGGGGGDVLLGGLGNDALYGDGDSDAAPDAGDYLDGGQGDDVIQGAAGDDVLVGGPGNDRLAGGAGQDFYIFERGDGVDVIDDIAPTAQTADRSVIILGPGATRENVKFRVGSLAIDYSAASDPDGEASSSTRDVIHIEGFNALNPIATPVLEELRFADGDVMRFDEILARGFDIDGTDEDDGAGAFTNPALAGTGVTDRIRGFGGRDSLVGLGGDDVLDGGDAGDILNGGDGNDVLWGGAGDDRLDGVEGNDRLDGGDGDDVLNGGAGDDVLVGDHGDDILQGGDGDDVYELELGAGADVIRDSGGHNRVRFGSGVFQGDLRVSRVPGEAGGVHWRFEYGAAGDEVIVRSDGSSTLSVGEQQAIDLVMEFADGSSIGFENLLGDLGSQPVHLINASERGVVSVGGRQADQLWGGAGPDILRGMGGNDSLGGGGGDDRLFGGDGDDLLVGGRGDDFLDGGAGTDVYRLTLGMGFDVVASGAGERDILEFGPDFRWEETRAWQRGTDLVIRHRDTREGVLIRGYFDPAASGAHVGWRVREGDAERPLVDMLDGWKPAGVPDTPTAWEALYRQGVNAFVDRTVRGFGYVREGDAYTLSETRTFGTEQSNRRIETWRASVALRTVDVASDGFLAWAGTGSISSESSRTTDTVSRTVMIHPRRVSFPLGGSTDISALPLAIPRVSSQSYVGGDGRSHKVSGTVSGDSPYVFNSPVTGSAFYYPRSITIVPDQFVDLMPYPMTYTDTYLEKSYSLTANVHHLRGTETDEQFHVDLGPVESSRSDRGLGLFSVVDAGAGDDLLGSEFDAISSILHQSYEGALFVRSADAAGGDTSYVPGLYLYGNDGADVLNASGGDDILIGGRGDDRLVGGGGNDTYVLASDGSRDTIYDGGAGLAGSIRENTVVFPVGVGLADLRFAWDVRQYVPLSIWGHNYFVASRHAVLELTWGSGVGDAGIDGAAVDIVVPHPETQAGLGIDFFKFADGTEIPFDDILRMLPTQDLDPSAADETTAGDDGDDQFAGNAGDDVLEGGGGDDLLVGGAGQDLLSGGPGRDHLYGGDYVYSALGDGYAWLGTLWDGGNVFRGGPGDDRIYAGGGSDVFEVNRGDGWDEIIDLRHEPVYGAVLGPGGAWPDVYIPAEAVEHDVYVLEDEHRTQFVNARDVLRFGPGILPEHIVAERGGFDLVVHYAGPRTGIVFRNWFNAGENQLASVVFSDNSVWTQQDLLARIDAPYHPDVLNHAPIVGQSPAPIVVRAGQELRWLVPDGLIRDDDPDDTVSLTLRSSDGAELPGWIQQVSTDLPSGLAHVMVLTPGAAQIGSHHVRLVGTDLENLSSEQLLTIDVRPANRAPRIERELASITTGPLSPLERSIDLGGFVDDDGDALRFDLSAGGGGQLPAWVMFDAATGRLRIAPSSTDTGSHTFDLRATDPDGASAVSRFSVVVGADIRGSRLADVLVGTDGDDVIAGGPGNDRLSGGTGDDRYRYAPFEGIDIITDTGGNDGLLLPSSLRPTDVVARLRQTAAGAVLQLRIVDSLGTELTSQGMDVLLAETPSTGGAINAPVEYLQFGDGAPLPVESFIVRQQTVQLADDVSAYSGTRHDETIFAGTTTRSIVGMGGHDLIHAVGGALTARGGAGQDYIRGSFEGDRLYGDGGEDILSGRNGDDRLDGGSGADALLGGDGADVLIGNSGMDILAGGRGDDTIDGFDAGDVVVFNRGDGADRLSGGTSFSGTLSLGGGVSLQDLTLSRTGADLVLHAGQQDRVTLVDWYRTPTVRWAAMAPVRLQILGHDGAQSEVVSPQEDGRAEWFNLRALAGAFDQARTRTPTLDRWSLAESAAAFHLGGSDERAYGGDIAWWLGGLGAPDGVLSVAQARASLEPQGFIAPRVLKPLAAEGPWVQS